MRLLWCTKLLLKPAEREPEVKRKRQRMRKGGERRTESAHMAVSKTFILFQTHWELVLAQDYKLFPWRAEILSVLSECQEWQPPCSDLKTHRCLKGCV